MNKLPNAIIVGIMRCGTTSLFRYLSAHPAVFTAAKKELNVFYDHYTSSEVIKEYGTYFKGYKGYEKIILEASPNYMRKSDTIPKRIVELIPDAKLILMLRNPVDRIQSAYKAIKRSGTIDDSTSFECYIENMLEDKPDLSMFNSSDDLEELSTEIERGLYSNLLANVIASVPRDQIYVTFTENIAAFPAGEMERICGFLNLDPIFYKSFQYQVENPTINAKWPKIYRFALKCNAMLEPALSKMPHVRSNIRDIHHSLNKSKSENKFSDKVVCLLDAYYENDRKNLVELINQVCSSPLPKWLKGS